MTPSAVQLDLPPVATARCDAAAPVSAEGLSVWLDDQGSPPQSVAAGSPLILQNVRLEIAPACTVALLGANGAGKSTLLRVLATLTPFSQGSLRLFGQDVRTGAADVRSRIGIIAHQPMLYRDLSARVNLEFFGKLHDLDRPRQRAEEMLGVVGLLARADDPVRKLSRGMVQRLSIARALLHDPDLLLADEPFDGLDSPSARTPESLMARLRDQGKALIVSNHAVEQSLALSDTVVVLRRGRVVLDRPAAGLSASAVLEEMAGL